MLNIHNTLRACAASLAVLLLSSQAMAANTAMADIENGPLQSYTPALQGQTDQPGVTYAADNGSFFTLGDMTFVDFVITTSGTTTKTTLTDSLAVSLPLPAVLNVAAPNFITCDAENATPVTEGSIGVIGNVSSQLSQVTFLAQIGTPPATNGTTMTWGATAPGIGVLSHAITIRCAGWYQTGQ